MEDDGLFKIVSDAILWHLSAPDKLRGVDTLQLRHALAAAAPALQQTTVRMIAVATSARFPTFLEIALLLACDTMDNCELENVVLLITSVKFVEFCFYGVRVAFRKSNLPCGWERNGDGTKTSEDGILSKLR